MTLLSARVCRLVAAAEVIRVVARAFPALTTGSTALLVVAGTVAVACDDSEPIVDDRVVRDYPGGTAASPALPGQASAASVRAGRGG